ncbi:MAG TPA: AraC family transcriptional regulator [Clostridiaceae bacterium]
MEEPYFEEFQFGSTDIIYPFNCSICDNSNKEMIYHSHWHYYIELLYILQGEARIFLGGDYFDTSKGDFILINSREVHQIYAKEGKHTRYIVIKFDPEVLYTTSRSIFEAKYVIPFTMAKSLHQKVFFKEDIDPTEIPNLVERIYKEFKDKNYGFELAIRTYIGSLFLWVLRSWEKKGVKLQVEMSSKDVDTKKLQIILNHLDLHYNEEISVEAMAKLCNMSYSYFSRHFKRVMRKTFTEYLNYIRVTEAEKLLLSTDLNVTQIGLNTGFTSSSYFIKQFKHYKNISPKQYKKRTLAD